MKTEETTEVERVGAERPRLGVEDPKDTPPSHRLRLDPEIVVQQEDIRTQRTNQVLTEISCIAGGAEVPTPERPAFGPNILNVMHVALLVTLQMYAKKKARQMHG